MAQAIRCDAEGHDHLADLLVSNLANGETLAYCFDAYVAACAAIVAAASDAEAEATDAEAEARLATVDVAATPEPAEAEAEPDRQPEIVTDPTPAIEPAHVVRRGRSAGRQAHEARRRSHEVDLTTATAEPVPGPDDPTDDPTDEPAIPEAVEA